MAEEENGQEKTEEATPKRMEKAREEGQVARSRELGTTLLLMTGAVSLLIAGPALSSMLQGLMRFNFDFDRKAAMDPTAMISQLAGSVSGVIGLVGLLLVAMMIAGIIGAIGLGGWLASAKPLMPKFSRLDPIKGLQRMFSLKALVELFKAVAKFLLVALVATLILFYMEGDLLALSQQALELAVVHATWIIIWSAIGMSAITILIAAIDVPYQIYDNAQKMRMTRQQVKDEFKDSEGKPEVKSRVRQLQRELAQSRMMSAVPDADVVITNPEHFSVALKYDMSGSGAPKVVAKGADEIAMKIREIANIHQVPLLPSPMLTRAIYFTTDIDQEIPERLYLAVAQVLAYIYQLRDRHRYSAPSMPSNFDRKLDIPTDLHFDAEGEMLD